jgi:iron complex outermembrane receptor protein
VAQSGQIIGRITDAATGEPIPGAWVLVSAPAAAGDATMGRATDANGAFAIGGLAPGAWVVATQALGYQADRRPIRVTDRLQRLGIRLQPMPVQLAGTEVSAPRSSAPTHSPAAVEVVRVQPTLGGASLPALLDQAVGVSVRRQGGLGSFSTVSIRGSTAEQVQVYLDGVPLNQALGGAVNVGDLPLSGVESVEVYRGAIPASLGGNSLGGVIRLRTRTAEHGWALKVNSGSGSFGTRQLGGSLAGAARQSWQYLAVADLVDSRNDFPFLDDNGTEYNHADDQPAVRANSDYRSLRLLGKLAHRRGSTRAELHQTADFSHQGLPGLGNNQAQHVRTGTRRSVTEGETAGVLARLGGVAWQLGAYQLFQWEAYRDPFSEIGTGIQDTRNTTLTRGVRSAADVGLPIRCLLSLSARAQRELFTPRDRRRPTTRLVDSRRHSGTIAAEVQVPLLGDRLHLTGGQQVTANDDQRAAESSLAPAGTVSRRQHREVLWGRQAGFGWQPLPAWSLRGHVANHQRAPSFFELFGDRGAVLGNSDLKSEHGLTMDLGLTRQGAAAHARVQVLELCGYRSVVGDLIRFMQNSQRVSRPYNIGRVHTTGVELRLGTRWPGDVDVGGSYVYQRAIDRSPLSYHRGRDLPNAPRQVADVHVRIPWRRTALSYALQFDGRHYLDRANLRPVDARLEHNAKVSCRLWTGGQGVLEGRNLTDRQAADLWGYPLPRRSWYLSLQQEFTPTHPGGPPP